MGLTVGRILKIDGEDDTVAGSDGAELGVPVWSLMIRGAAVGAAVGWSNE